MSTPGDRPDPRRPLLSSDDQGPRQGANGAGGTYENTPFLSSAESDWLFSHVAPFPIESPSGSSNLLPASQHEERLAHIEHALSQNGNQQPALGDEDEHRTRQASGSHSSTRPSTSSNRRTQRLEMQDEELDDGMDSAPSSITPSIFVNDQIKGEILRYLDVGNYVLRATCRIDYSSRWL